MRECRELEPLFAVYVDGDAPWDQRRRIEAHLEACPACRQTVDCGRQVRTVLRARAGGLTPSAPVQLRQRCAACVCGPRREAGTAVRFVRRRWLPLSFAATLLLAVATVFAIGWSGSVEALATQLALDHVKCFQFAPAHAEVDAQAAGESWRAHYGWLVNVPRSAPVEDLELLDVRRCLSTRGATAHILYRWRGAPLSLYVLDGVPKSGISAEVVVARVGQEAVVWSDAGQTYAVVGRGRPADLQHIAHYMARISDAARPHPIKDEVR